MGSLFILDNPVQQCLLSFIIATILTPQETPTNITESIPCQDKLDDLALIEKRLENWFVKQSQSSVHFTGNVKKRFDSLPVAKSHKEFGELQVKKSAEGVITGMANNVGQCTFEFSIRS